MEEESRSNRSDPFALAAQNALAGSDTGSEDEELPWIENAINNGAESNIEDEVEDLQKKEEV